MKLLAIALLALVACSQSGPPSAISSASPSPNRAVTYAIAANHDAKCTDWGTHGGMVDADTAWCDVGGGAMFWCSASAVAPPSCVASVDSRPRLPPTAAPGSAAQAPVAPPTTH